jgi:hypothetical protein
VWRKRDPRVTAEQATEYLMDLAWSGLAGRTGRSTDP